MNKKYIILLSLIITLEALIFGKVALTDGEIALLDEIESLSRTEDIILTLNLPLIGELDLFHYVEPENRSLIFVNKKKINLNLSPAPLQLEDIRIIENNGDLEFQARATIFGRNAQVSLAHLKRATDIKIIQREKTTKLFLDISEMTLVFNFNDLNIRLLNELNLNFSAASVILGKNKSHQFLVKNHLLDQSVDFDFTFLDDGITVIKYFITNDILLSQLFSGIPLDFDDIVLKSLSLTSEHKSSSLFSQGLDFKMRGNAFADIQLTSANLPKNVVDLPISFSYSDNKYSLELKLPEFKLPLLGVISKPYLRLSDSLPSQLVGHGILNVPELGKHSFELDANYKNGAMIVRGKFNHSFKYNDFIIESPKFMYSKNGNSLKIVGRSTIHTIKCLIDLTFKNVNSPEHMVPELKIRTLQKSWKPFVDSSNPNVSAIELLSPGLEVINNKGKQEITVIGRTKLLNNDTRAHIKFVHSARGIIPVFTVLPPESWKISDSFEHIKQFDDFIFSEPQFIISDEAFYDPKEKIYFKKGINFTGKLLLNKAMKSVSNLIVQTDGTIKMVGSITDDLTNFVWHGPLATGLSSKSKAVTIGPMHLELNSQVPVSINSKVTVRPVDGQLLDFTGNFKLKGNKLIFDSVSPDIWRNVFSIPGLHMLNPKLYLTLDNDYFRANSMPDTLLLEGDISFGTNKMHAKSIMNEDFSKFSLTGHWDHFWLNELAHIAISNKHSYSILPPLEIKNIVFNISADNGLLLEGALGIFGLGLDVHCEVNNLGLKTNGVLPKMAAPGIEFLSLDRKSGPHLFIELIGDVDNSKMVGITKLGDLIEIHDPITITSQGCSFDSNTTIGKQKFGIKITGTSLGFVKMPEFNLDFTFKNDAISYFKRVISNEITAIDMQLKAEVNTVITDINILESNADSLIDPEQNKLVMWALNENKRKLSLWLERGLVTLNTNGTYLYHGFINNFDLTDITFQGTPDKIRGFKIPLTFSISIWNEKDTLKCGIDFANLDQSIKELVKEIKLLA